MAFRSGRHSLQIPGPTNLPDRVLRAMDQPLIDHRGPEFPAVTKAVVAGLKRAFKCSGPVAIYPSSGTGAWEAAILNTLSPGDKVLAFETGQFSTLWTKLAQRHGIEVDLIPGDWRHPADPAQCEAKLVADKGHAIKAVLVLQSETSTGVASDIAGIRRALDRARHPALLLVDTISSLAIQDFRHDEWGVDVTVGGSQKGLMLPPGLGFNAISKKALAAGKTAKLPRAYFDWQPMIDANDSGYYPYTPATLMFFGLKESLAMLDEEGLDNVFARHDRLAEATRRAVRAWGLEIQCADPKAYTPSLTAVRVPDGFDADEVRKTILDRFDIALGAGLGKVLGKVFRIGHLAYINETLLLGTLAGVELGLAAAGVPVKRGGVDAAMDYLGGNTPAAAAPAVAAARR
ncbi:MAG: aminotransferase class V-fold PLP-dependent enzyme [Alphaproteobacteria bacterium]|nr:aminotransferase class V-fold PLP-dependent enzyme [Alphaproteobacteria bacterium]